MKSILTKLEIIFSYKESVVVPVKYVLSPGVRGIKEFRHMNCKGLYCEENEEPVIFKGKLAEMIDITIAKEAVDKIFTSAGTEFFNEVLGNNDITRIELKYSDGTEEIIFADYSPDFATSENEWQGSNTINGGRLVIFVHNPAAISY